MKLCAKIALYLLAVAVLAFHLPRLYDRIMFERINKTHLLYSPVVNRFVYTESLTGYDPEAASKAEDHHSNIVYKDQDGVYYDRLEFERLLPFIYYRNMEVRGLLPMEIGGRVFDAADMRQDREVMELLAVDLDGRKPPEDVWPLFEAEPGQAALIFPDDRCRFTDDALEFVNADFNRVDPRLTDLFTSALRDAGFAFPARHVAGKFTILKLSENGVFIVDANHALFNLMRLHGQPRVRRIPLPDGLVPRHVQVSDNQRYHGLLLDTAGRIHLMRRDDDSLQPLPLEGYDADRMDFKILFNPLYRTAVYSDETIIRGVAMDTAFRKLDDYQHRMSHGLRTWKHELRDVIFPFRITLDSPETQMTEAAFRPGKYALTLAPLAGILFLIFCTLLRRQGFGGKTFWTTVLLAAVAGIYGLIAAFFIEEASPGARKS